MSLKSAAAALFAAAVLATSSTSARAEVPESTDPIKVVLNDWTGQHVSATIAGELLKKMGYTVEYVSAGALPQFVGISQGNLHFQTEIWTNNITDLYPKSVASGDINILGDLGLEPKEGWLYPPYMEEKCPGLPSYQALYECAQAFANAETFPNGRLIAYPADWGTRSRDVIAAIDLPFKPIPGGSEGAMVAELKSAVTAQDPVIMMFWQPHWIFADIDFNWVEWNAVEGECVEESQSKDTACGFQQARVEKIIWSGAEAKWPAAYKMLTALTITNADENAAILEIDTKGRSLEEVVAEWIDNNEARWKPWIDAAIQ